MAKSNGRKKVNFMFDNDIMVRFYGSVPAGKRSDFINDALNEALIKFARRKASDDMDEFAKKNKWKLSTDEFIKLKNHGRP